LFSVFATTAGALLDARFTGPTHASDHRRLGGGAWYSSDFASIQQSDLVALPDDALRQNDTVDSSLAAMFAS